jgi:hypothetical protein
MIDNQKIILIQKSADLLEKGDYKSFWAEFSASPQLFNTALGFAEAVRSFILNILRDTFKTIPLAIFLAQLGLKESELVSFASSSNLIEKIDKDSVVFVANDENQNRGKVFGESVKMDEHLGLLEFLSSQRNL